MEWFVYNYNINKHEIEAFNIFQHGGFAKYFGKHIRTIKDKAEFAEAVRKELFYYYGSKAEDELIVRLTDDDRVFLLPWCGSSDPENEKVEVTDDHWRDFAKLHITRRQHTNEAKIDIYNQVTFRLYEFINYCWSFKRRLI